MKLSWYALCIVPMSILLAQTPDTLWTRMYGGTFHDVGLSVIQTMPDSGYLIAGYTESYTGYANEAYFIKTDRDGDTLWTNRLGTYTTATSIVQSGDYGYAATGNYYNDGYAAMKIWKMDVNGGYQWGKTYDLDQRTYGAEIQNTTDGGYIVAGTVYDTAGYSDVIMLKTDAMADTSWSRRYDLGGSEVGCSVQETEDKGFVISGYASSVSYFDVLLLKTDSLGNMLWSHAYGDNYWDEGHRVRVTSDSGFVIVGQWGQSSSNQDVYIVRTDETGDTCWTRHYDWGSWDRAESIEQTDDGGYIMTGRLWQPSQQSDIWVLKTDTNGDTLWTAIYGGNYNDEGYSVRKTTDGGYIVVGYTQSFGGGESDIWLLKIEPDTFGVVEGSKRYCSCQDIDATIIRSELFLQFHENCRVFDIRGRLVEPREATNGVYFVEEGNRVFQKVVIIR